MKANPVVLISGGGTGGHIFPAIAIGKAIVEKYPEAIVEFVGAKDKMEMQKVPQAGFKIHGLWISGLQRKLTLQNALFPFKLMNSLWNARKLINKIKPDIAIGVGGFASGPLLEIANRKGIATLLQEQNSFPGITNKLLAKKANTICVAFDNMDRFFPANKIVLTGNPIRKDILRSVQPEEARTSLGLDPTKKTLLIIGGSLGARTINQAIAASLEKLKEQDVQILWQTGKFYNEIHTVHGKQTVFIDNMSEAYDAADLVISRAGALSISELCAKKKACILVPSPNVSEDHQTKNAMALVNKNAAEMIVDSVAGDQLVARAIELIDDPQQLKTLQANIAELAVLNATDLILNEIEKLIP